MSSISRQLDVPRRPPRRQRLEFEPLDADESGLHGVAAGLHRPARIHAVDDRNDRRARPRSRERRACSGQDDCARAPSDRPVASAGKSVAWEASADRRAGRTRTTATRYPADGRAAPRRGGVGPSSGPAAPARRRHRASALGASPTRSRPTATAERVPHWAAPPARHTPWPLPAGAATLPGGMARASGGEFRRVGVRPPSVAELGGCAWADAVPAVDLACVRPRRERPRPSGRDSGGGELPTRVGRAARLPKSAVRIQPLVVVRGGSRAIRGGHEARPPSLLRLSQLAGLRTHAVGLASVDRTWPPMTGPASLEPAS